MISFIVGCLILALVIFACRGMDKESSIVGKIIMWLILGPIFIFIAIMIIALIAGLICCV